MRGLTVAFVLIFWSVVMMLPATGPAAQSRRANSVVMDVDLTEQAQGGGADLLTIVGTIQLILDRIAARTAPHDMWGDERSIIWLPVTAERECQTSQDTAILEVSYARFVTYQKQWVFIGRQHSEAQLAFRLIDCAGRQLLRYPNSDATYGSASFSPYYLSVVGTAATVAVFTAHSNNNVGLAYFIGLVNGYGPLQANIGAHDTSDLQELALFRLMGNIPGKNVPPPAPGTIASLLEGCRFFGQPGGHIALDCQPQKRQSMAASDASHGQVPHNIRS
jgi:hypothetical protein